MKMNENALADVRAKVQDVEWLVSSGKVPLEALPELKGAVDELRNHLWALITAAGAGDPGQVIARFRARRAAEMLRATCQDLQIGYISLQRKEMLGLTEATRDLLATSGASPT